MPGYKSPATGVTQSGRGGFLHYYCVVVDMVGLFGSGYSVYSSGSRNGVFVVV